MGRLHEQKVDEESARAARQYQAGKNAIRRALNIQQPYPPSIQLRMAAQVALDTLDAAVRQPDGAQFFEAYTQLQAALNRYR